MMQGVDCEDYEDLRLIGLGDQGDEVAFQNVEDDGDTSTQWADDDEGDEGGNGAEIIKPEEKTLFIPSSLSMVDLQRLGLSAIAKQELELRKGQANDTLEQLRLALGYKSLLFRKDVCLILL